MSDKSYKKSYDKSYKKPLYTVTKESIESSKKGEPKDPGYNSGTH